MTGSTELSILNLLNFTKVRFLVKCKIWYQAEILKHCKIKFVFNVSLTRFFEKYVNAKKIAILIAPEKSSVLLDRKIDYSWNFEILKWQNLVPTMN